MGAAPLESLAVQVFDPELSNPRAVIANANPGVKHVGKLVQYSEIFTPVASTNYLFVVTPNEERPALFSQITSVAGEFATGGPYFAFTRTLEPVDTFDNSSYSQVRVKGTKMKIESITAFQAGGNIGGSVTCGVVSNPPTPALYSQSRLAEQEANPAHELVHMPIYTEPTWLRVPSLGEMRDTFKDQDHGPIDIKKNWTATDSVFTNSFGAFRGLFFTYDQPRTAPSTWLFPGTYGNPQVDVNWQFSLAGDFSTDIPSAILNIVYSDSTNAVGSSVVAVPIPMQTTSAALLSRCIITTSLSARDYLPVGYETAPILGFGLGILNGGVVPLSNAYTVDAAQFTVGLGRTYQRDLWLGYMALTAVPQSFNVKTWSTVDLVMNSSTERNFGDIVHSEEVYGDVDLLNGLICRIIDNGTLPLVYRGRGSTDHQVVSVLAHAADKGHAWSWGGLWNGVKKAAGVVGSAVRFARPVIDAAISKYAPPVASDLIRQAVDVVGRADGALGKRRADGPAVDERPTGSAPSFSSGLRLEAPAAPGEFGVGHAAAGKDGNDLPLDLEVRLIRSLVTKSDEKYSEAELALLDGCKPNVWVDGGSRLADSVRVGPSRKAVARLAERAARKGHASSTSISDLLAAIQDDSGAFSGPAVPALAEPHSPRTPEPNTPPNSPPPAPRRVRSAREPQQREVREAVRGEPELILPPVWRSPTDPEESMLRHIMWSRSEIRRLQDRLSARPTPPAAARAAGRPRPYPASRGGRGRAAPHPAQARGHAADAEPRNVRLRVDTEFKDAGDGAGVIRRTVSGAVLGARADEEKLPQPEPDRLVPATPAQVSRALALAETKRVPFGASATLVGRSQDGPDVARLELNSMTDEVAKLTCPEGVCLNILDWFVVHRGACPSAGDVFCACCSALWTGFGSLAAAGNTGRTGHASSRGAFDPNLYVEQKAGASGEFIEQPRIDSVEKSIVRPVVSMPTLNTVLFTHMASDKEASPSAMAYLYCRPWGDLDMLTACGRGGLSHGIPFGDGQGVPNYVGCAFPCPSNPDDVNGYGVCILSPYQPTHSIMGEALKPIENFSVRHTLTRKGMTLVVQVDAGPTGPEDYKDLGAYLNELADRIWEMPVMHRLLNKRIGEFNGAPITRLYMSVLRNNLGGMDGGSFLGAFFLCLAGTPPVSLVSTVVTLSGADLYLGQVGMVDTKCKIANALTTDLILCPEPHRRAASANAQAAMPSLNYFRALEASRSSGTRFITVATFEDLMLAGAVSLGGHIDQRMVTKTHDYASVSEADIDQAEQLATKELRESKSYEKNRESMQPAEFQKFVDSAIRAAVPAALAKLKLVKPTAEIATAKALAEKSYNIIKRQPDFPKAGEQFKGQYQAARERYNAVMAAKDTDPNPLTVAQRADALARMAHTMQNRKPQEKAAERAPGSNKVFRAALAFAASRGIAVPGPQRKRAASPPPAAAAAGGGRQMDTGEDDADEGDRRQRSRGAGAFGGGSEAASAFGGAPAFELPALAVAKKLGPADFGKLAYAWDRAQAQAVVDDQSLTPDEKRSVMLRLMYPE